MGNRQEVELKIKDKKIVLITTGQPSCNPRIVKEADSLSNAGFDVTVLYSYFIQWAQENDELLLKNVSWKYKMVGGYGENNRITFFLTRFRFKISRIIIKYVGNKFLLAERAQARAYDELLQEAKKIKADWYIGHNLGALPIAVKAAKYNNAKAGFDFEDYHRGEGNDYNTTKRNVYLENKYVPSLKFISTSSDLITERTKQNHLSFRGKLITLRNCFPLTQQKPFRYKSEAETSLSLFWFSQTVGKHRGLELLIDALKAISNKSIQLTLAGKVDETLISYIKDNASTLITDIHFVGIIPPESLPEFASKFDIGLALEPGFSINNDIALSNKLFTYLLAGNAVILSETSMQKTFNDQFMVGESYAINNAKSLAEKIIFYLDTNKLNEQRKQNYELATNILNWERESKKLLEIIS